MNKYQHRLDWIHKNGSDRKDSRIETRSANIVWQRNLLETFDAISFPLVQL